MNAQEARRIASEVVDAKIKTQMDSIKLGIKDAVAKGLFSFSVEYERIFQDNKQALERQGFAITEGQGRDGYHFTIAW